MVLLLSPTLVTFYGKSIHCFVVAKSHNLQSVVFVMGGMRQQRSSRRTGSFGTHKHQYLMIMSMIPASLSQIFIWCKLLERHAALLKILSTTNST
jgi:hypothetical protein